MSKYSVGDKFVVEIEEVFTGDICNLTPMLYRIKGFNSLVFDENGLDRLQKVVTDEESHMELKASYDEGLNDAWDLARKISLTVDDGGISTQDLKRIFHIEQPFVPDYKIFKDFSPQEALVKLEAYEKEQAEIKVGDVVYVDGTRSRGIVIAINEIKKKARLMYEDTSFRTNEWYLADLRKTGKHIDLSAILAEIGKE